MNRWLPRCLSLLRFGGNDGLEGTTTHESEQEFHQADEGFQTGDCDPQPGRLCEIGPLLCGLDTMFSISLPMGK